MSLNLFHKLLCPCSTRPDSLFDHPMIHHTHIFPFSLFPFHYPMLLYPHNFHLNPRLYLVSCHPSGPDYHLSPSLTPLSVQSPLVLLPPHFLTLFPHLFLPSLLEPGCPSPSLISLTPFSSSSSRHPSRPITLLAHPSNFNMYRKKRNAKKIPNGYSQYVIHGGRFSIPIAARRPLFLPLSQTCQVSANRNTGFPSINDASLHFCKNRLIKMLNVYYVDRYASNCWISLP